MIVKGGKGSVEELKPLLISNSIKTLSNKED